MAQQFAGWTIEDEDGLYVAKRAGLSVYMLEHGAIGELDTRNYNELLLLINAQVTLVLNLAKAEAVYEQDVELRRRRIEMLAHAPRGGSS